MQYTAVDICDIRKIVYWFNQVLPTLEVTVPFVYLFSVAGFSTHLWPLAVNALLSCSWVVWFSPKILF